MKKRNTICKQIHATTDLKKIMPLHQQKALSHADVSVVKRLEKQLNEIPEEIINDSTDESIVHAHYYTPKTDFYVMSQSKSTFSFYGVWATNGKVSLKIKSVPIERFYRSKLGKLNTNFQKTSLKNIIQQKSMKKKTTNQLIKETTYVKMLMPKVQQKALTQQNTQFSKSLVKRIENELSEIPKAPQGDSVKKSTVYAHYFYGGSDWYITDIVENDNLLFGYVILNGDTQMAEAGYISINEIVNNGKIELDFYFTKDTLENILYKKYPKEYPNPKVDQNKPNKKVIKKITSVKMVDHFSTEYRLIKRFYNLIKTDATVTFRRIQLLHAAFQKAALNRSVRKATKNADLFTDVNEKVVDLFKKVNPTKSDANINFTDKNMFNEIESYVTKQKVNYAITLLNSYINLQGLKPEIKKVNRLLKRINNALEQGKVKKNNRLYKELVNAKLALETYLGTPNKKIAPKQIGLSIPARYLCTNRIKCDGLRKDGKLNKGYQFIKGGNVVQVKKKAV